jgi:hypothetical protein
VQVEQERALANLTEAIPYLPQSLQLVAVLAVCKILSMVIVVVLVAVEVLTVQLAEQAARLLHQIKVLQVVMARLVVGGQLAVAAEQAQ